MNKLESGQSRLADNESCKAKTVLHVGAGDRATARLHWSFKGWNQITVDVEPRCLPDVIASITSMPEIKSCSVEAVYGAHVLEHIHAHEVPLALAEFLRVLKPDGDLLLHMPDLQQACAAVAEGRAEQYLYQAPGGAVAALDMIYGHRPGVKRFGPAMAHRTGFTQETLRRHLEKAGFLEVKTWVDGYDLWATAQKAKDERSTDTH